MNRDLTKLMNCRTIESVRRWSSLRCVSTTTGNRNLGASEGKAQNVRRTGNPGSSDGVDTGRAVRKTVVYLAQKQKEEILALHEEDPVRWTATVLATRFGAPQENVKMLLRLGQERIRRQKYINGLPGEQKLSIEKLKEQAVAAWSELSTESSPSSRRAHAPYSRAHSLPKHHTSSSRPTKSADELRAIALENDVDDSDPHVAEASKESDTGDESDKMVAKESQWAKNLDDLCANAELDTVRRYSFAFIEVGRTKKVHRGVWLREGQSGKLRKANDEERKLFLNAVNIRDSKAFSQAQ